MSNNSNMPGSYLYANISNSAITTPYGVSSLPSSEICCLTSSFIAWLIQVIYILRSAVGLGTNNVVPTLLDTIHQYGGVH